MFLSFAKRLYFGLLSVLNKLLFFGRARYCPICRSHVRHFLPWGVHRRPDALCPVCYSLERHRATWLWFQRHSDLWDCTPRRMLHVAPEIAIERQLRRIPELQYLTADLSSPTAMVKMDITDIQYPDASFDVIFCSHVLEHVPEDRKAMRELRRVLRPGGWALLEVPVRGEETFEHPSVTDPQERKRIYGQFDHVRIYGTDISMRLEEAGFSVQCLRVRELFEQSEIEKMRLKPNGYLFVCSA